MTGVFDGPAVVRAGQGREIAALGRWRKVGGEHFGGRLLVMEGVIPPGVLIDAHTHTREDECSLILGGELSYLVGEQVVEVTAGCYVPKPRQVPHAFWNVSARPARVVEIHTPATFDHYYDRLGALFEIHDPGTAEFRAGFRPPGR